MSRTQRDDRSDRLGCHQVRRILQAFLDGEVEPLRAELVAAHLESCSRCQVEAEMLSRVIGSLRQLRPDLDLAAYTRLVEVTEQLTGHQRDARRLHRRAVGHRCRGGHVVVAAQTTATAE